ncbi:Aminomethyltransferase, mitochondrial [Savitreella phatthalungensis]
MLRSRLRSSAVPHLRGFATAGAVATTLRQSPLNDLHVSLGGKMVPFAGWSLPVLYGGMSLGESHLWTRGKSSIFDVSHMCQFVFKGEHATAFLETVIPAGLRDLPRNRSTLSLILDPHTAGILDDLIVTKWDDHTYYVVTNAATRDKDLAHFQSQLTAFAQASNKQPPTLQELTQNALIAIQGPEAHIALASVLDRADAGALDTVTFGGSRHVHVSTGDGGSVGVHVARGGYTGEDGFEISVGAGDVRGLVDRLLDGSSSGVEVRMAGLGVRDSLRLEAGMCLYGHDLDATVTPAEANLMWTIPAHRRARGEGEVVFNGRDALMAQIEEGKVRRKRVGLVVDGAPAREGAPVYELALSDTQPLKGPTKDREPIGKVTSGCPSPSLGKNIAMAYVPTHAAKSGTLVDLLVRGKLRRAEVTKMPFVKTNYVK